jgi:hypoxanthine-DNA glycosylase
MSDIQSFPPIIGPNARILILGSIPGAASLAANEYYAHPRNLFWRIIADLLDTDPLLDYSSKTQALIRAQIALWDVMKSCYRPGSLDAAIDKQSIVANDFNALFKNHPQIQQVFFNGATAEQSFRRLVLLGLNCLPLSLQRLPSTSPAHAAMSYQQKLAHWRMIKGFTRMKRALRLG